MLGRSFPKFACLAAIGRRQQLQVCSKDYTWMENRTLTNKIWWYFKLGRSPSKFSKFYTGQFYLKRTTPTFLLHHFCSWGFLIGDKKEIEIGIWFQTTTKKSNKTHYSKCVKTLFFFKNNVDKTRLLKTSKVNIIPDVLQINSNKKTYCCIILWESQIRGVI